MEQNKHTGTHILKGAMILSIAVFISKIIGILYRIPLTDAIGDAGNGIFAPAYQVYMVMLTLSSVALPTAISKMVSERVAIGAYEDAQRVYKIAMRYSIIVGAILSIVLWVGADVIATTFFNMKEAAWPMRALVPAIFIVAIMAVMRGYFQGMNSMTPTAISQVVEQFVHAIVSVGLAYLLISTSLEAAVVGASFGTSVGALFALGVLVLVYYMMRPSIKKRLRKSKTTTDESSGEILKKILVMSIPIMISSSIFSIMGMIDYTMIYQILPNTIEKISQMGLLDTLPISDPSVLLDQASIVNSLGGQFSTKYTSLLNLPVSLILTLGMAVIPAISASMARQDFKDVRRKTKMVLKIGMLFAAPATIGLMIFGKQIVGMLYASAPDGGELLTYGAISVIFITIAQLTTGVLQGMGKQAVPTAHAAIACGVKVIFNIILLSMPSMHIYGVVHSTTICYFIYAALNVIYLMRTMHIHLNVKQIIIKPVLVAVVMGVVSYLLYALLYKFIGHASVCLLIVIPIAAGVYGVLGLLTHTITIKDLEHIPGGRKVIGLLSRY
ncbi:MAG: polysaccharide biosynthesis C-terminal domain-containing protein [Zhenhengia sp.]|jgi:stage V sporulation protein B|uniref:putative polysaccharide biosynthesis protein n=1 Tax=Zhenhengia sp. TaxID=2944208 RepID=UPI002909EA2E|nr:polysaccharide biosynthesis protein [Clostridiales bacterium]MDU6853830.1 polysaccharide biosynthesis protein [Clostridiales bacterium]MDU6973683.1 polysaccharide biosynthesis protein [Clostridiales bacterium]